MARTVAVVVTEGCTGFFHHQRGLYRVIEFRYCSTNHRINFPIVVDVVGKIQVDLVEVGAEFVKAVFRADCGIFELAVGHGVGVVDKILQHIHVAGITARSCGCGRAVRAGV